VEDLDLRLLGVVVSRHGEVIDTGAGAAALGNPARCVAWLANKLGSLGSGLKAGDIAMRLFLSVATVRTHIQNVLNKLEVGSQERAVAIYRAMGGPVR